MKDFLKNFTKKMKIRNKMLYFYHKVRGVQKRLIRTMDIFKAKRFLLAKYWDET